MKSRLAMFALLLTLCVECFAQEITVGYVGTGKSWWDVKAHFHDPNSAKDYGYAFDGDTQTLTKEVMFKRHGGIDTRQSLPIITGFNFGEPFSGVIKVFMDFRTSPQGISNKKLYEIGGYYLSFMCAKSIVKREGDDFIILPDQSVSSYMIKNADILLSEIPDNGLMQGFEMNVENCQGLMLRELSTSMMSIDDGRLNSYVIFRRIRDIQFIPREVDRPTPEDPTTTND